MEIKCGIDEAGRGPIAGPVCAAAVVLDNSFPFEVLNDSKKLTEKKRFAIEAIIKEKAVSWALGWVNHRTIDKINILEATMVAMQKAYTNLESKVGKVDLTLVDGNKAPSLNCKVVSVVKGDSKIYEIMAASILAKCARDRLMITLDKKFPNYGYAKHKGYGTKAHRIACVTYGPSPIQRLSFNYRF